MADFTSRERYTSGGLFLDRAASSPQNVNVVGMADAALSGIVAAIDQSRKLIERINNNQDRIINSTEDTASAVREGNNEASSQHKHDVVASLAKERNDRAANAAILGKVDKVLSFTEILKTTLNRFFDKIHSLLKEGFRQTLRSYDDFSKQLRQQKISNVDKKALQLRSDEAFLAASQMGFNVSKRDINEFSISIKDQPEFKNLSASQLALAAQLKSNNVDNAAALNLLRVSSEKDSEILQKIALRSTDQMDNGATAALMKTFIGTVEGARLASQMGVSQAQMALKLQEQALSLRYSSGGLISGDNAAKLIQSKLLMDNKMPEQLQGTDVGNLLVAVGNSATDNGKSLSEILIQQRELLKNGGAAAFDKIQKQLYVLSKAEGIDKSLVDQLSTMYYKMQNGSFNPKDITSWEDKDSEYAKRNADNTPEGKFNQGIQSLVSKANTLTGGIFSTLSVDLDEMFGGSMQMEEITDIAKTGFIQVCKYLRDIKISMAFNSLKSLLNNPAIFSKLSSRFPKLTGFLTKFGMGGGAAAATGAAAGAVPPLNPALRAAQGLPPLANTGARVGALAANTGANVASSLSGVGNTAAKTSKFSQILGKIGGKAPGIGAVLMAVAGGIEVANILSTEDKSALEKLVSQDAKNKVAQAEKEARQQKAVVKGVQTAVTTGGLIAGGALGAKIGGVIGTAGGPLGTILGVAIGGAIGAGAAAIAKPINEAIEVSKNTKESVLGIEDLENRRDALQAALKDPNATDEQKQRWTKELEEIEKKLIPDAIKQGVSDLTNVFRKYSDTAEDNSDVLSQLNKLLKEDEANLQKADEAKTKALDALIQAKGTDSETALQQEYDNAADAYDQALEMITRTKEAMATTAKEGYGFEKYGVKDIYAYRMASSGDVRGDGFGNTKELEEYNAARNLSKENFGEYILNQKLDKITNGLTYDTLDSIKKYVEAGNYEVVTSFLKSQNKDLSDTDIIKLYKKILAYAEIDRDEYDDAYDYIPKDFKVELVKNKFGGIYNSATNALIGEAGKEIVLPLTRPDRMRALLGALTGYEKASIASAIASSSSSDAQQTAGTASPSAQTSGGIDSLLGSLFTTGVPGDDPSSIKTILGYSSNPQYVLESLLYGRDRNGNLKYKKPKGPEQRLAWYKESIQNAANQEGRDLIRGTWAERALDWGVSQIGKPYLLRAIGKIGYVCNELTNAALVGSGFDMKDFRIHSVRATFNNIQNGKYVSGKDRKGRMREYPMFRLRPDITPETAVPGMVFFQDSSKNKDGQFSPGHVGLVYYGHQRLHSAGGSGSYDGADAFLNKYQTPCRGVTVNPFDPNARYQFGEFPGLFEQATGEWNPPENSPVKFGPNELDSSNSDILAEQLGISKEMTDAISNAARNFLGANAANFIKQAQEMTAHSDIKSILSFLSIMTKYLKDMSTYRNMASPNRPTPTKF